MPKKNQLQFYLLSILDQIFNFQLVQLGIKIPVKKIKFKKKSIYFFFQFQPLGHYHALLGHNQAPLGHYHAPPCNI